MEHFRALKLATLPTYVCCFKLSIKDLINWSSFRLLWFIIVLAFLNFFTNTNTIHKNTPEMLLITCVCMSERLIVREIEWENKKSNIIWCNGSHDWNKYYKCGKFFIYFWWRLVFTGNSENIKWSSKWLKGENWKGNKLTVTKSINLDKWDGIQPFLFHCNHTCNKYKKFFLVIVWEFVNFLSIWVANTLYLSLLIVNFSLSCNLFCK